MPYRTSMKPKVSAPKKSGLWEKISHSIFGCSRWSFCAPLLRTKDGTTGHRIQAARITCQFCDKVVKDYDDDVDRPEWDTLAGTLDLWKQWYDFLRSIDAQDLDAYDSYMAREKAGKKKHKVIATFPFGMC